MPRGGGRFAVAVLGVGTIVGVLLPVATRDPYQLDVATMSALEIALAMSLRLVMTTGQLNMAHVSFMGIGAYASAALAMQLGLSAWVVLPAAAGVAALFALGLGMVTLRISGPYFFLATFALLEIVRLFFQTFFEGVFGGASGLIGVPSFGTFSVFGWVMPVSSLLGRYYVALIVVVLVASTLVRLDYSRFGMMSNAVRQAEMLAATLGVNTLYYKVVALVIASGVAGLVGGVFAHTQGVVHPSDFDIGSMLRLVSFVVIGGIGSVWGPVLGTVALSTVSEYLRGLQQYETLVYGVVLVSAMRFWPDGLVGVFERVHGAATVKRDAGRGSGDGDN